MINNKFIPILLCTLFIFFLVVGTSCKNTEVIKIGMLGDMTGRSSYLGVSARNAVVQAVEEFNESSQEFKIQLVIKDDRGVPEETAKIIDDFIKEDINIVIGPITSNSAMIIKELPIEKSNNIVFVSPTVSGNFMIDVDDNFIMLIDGNDKQGVILAEASIDQGLKKIATIYEYNNRGYSEPVVKSFEKSFKSLDGEIVYSKYFESSEHAPFSEISNEMIASDADGILIVAGGLDSSQLIQYIHKQKPDMPIYCGMWANTTDFISNGGKAIEGTHLIGIMDLYSDYPEFKEFRKNYYDLYNIEPTFASMCGYESTRIIIDAIQRSSTLEPRVIKDEIINHNTYKGLDGKLYINKFGDSQRLYTIFQVQEGKYIKVKE